MNYQLSEYDNIKSENHNFKRLFSFILLPNYPSPGFIGNRIFLPNNTAVCILKTIIRTADTTIRTADTTS